MKIFVNTILAYYLWMSLRQVQSLSNHLKISFLADFFFNSPVKNNSVI